MLWTMVGQADPTPLKFSHTDSTQALPEKIWAVWTDVPQWHTWDKGLKKVVLSDSFHLNAKGFIYPDNGPKSKFIISELAPGKSYTFKTRIPFGWLYVTRKMVQKNGWTYFTHEVEFTSLLKSFFAKKLGANYRSILPQVMQEIKKQAEEKS